MNYAYYLLISLLLLNCASTSTKEQKNQQDVRQKPTDLILPTGKTIKDRFALPKGFVRDSVQKDSFGAYLRDLPLKENGYKARLFNGELKEPQDVYDAVIDMEIGKTDLQQCADAVMRLRGEYLYHSQQYDKIAFHFTNGFLAEYAKWAEGNRLSITGNQVKWTKKVAADNSYPSFRKYMDAVFMYAGTLSLNKELKPVEKWDDIQIGDVVIYGGSPGHCVIVVDAAHNPTTKEKIFLIAQSWMPAQDIHILKNPHHNPEISPWYSSRFEGDFLSAECRFEHDDLKRW